MDNNVYAPPKAEIREAAPAAEIPEEVTKKIRNAVIVGCISTVVTLAAVLIALTGVKFLGFSAWEFFDVALLAGLTFGIHKKSRTCAVIMLIYFIISKALMMRQTGVGGGIVLSLVFLYYYAQGIAGTFQYHKLMRESGAEQRRRPAAAGSLPRQFAGVIPAAGPAPRYYRGPNLAPVPPPRGASPRIEYNECVILDMTMAFRKKRAHTQPASKLVQAKKQANQKRGCIPAAMPEPSPGVPSVRGPMKACAFFPGSRIIGDPLRGGADICVRPAYGDHRGILPGR